MGSRQEELIFVEWSGRLAALERAFDVPLPEPLEPGPGLNRPVTREWKSIMATRDELLRPLASDMAHRYSMQLDDAGRRRCGVLLSTHPRVQWQWPGRVRRTFDAFLQTRDPSDLRDALALTAIYDRPSQGRDFLRTIYPIRARMTAAGLDPGAIFDDATRLAIRHDDPTVGAFALFTTLGRSWDPPPTPPPPFSPDEAEAVLSDWQEQVDALEQKPSLIPPDLYSLGRSATQARRHQFDDYGRRRVRTVLDGHPRVTAVLKSSIRRIVENAGTHNLRTDLDLAIGLIAMSDEAAQDESIRTALGEAVRAMSGQGLDTEATFAEELRLTPAHLDRADAARTLFEELREIR